MSNVKLCTLQLIIGLMNINSVSATTTNNNGADSATTAIKNKKNAAVGETSAAVGETSAAVGEAAEAEAKTAKAKAEAEAAAAAAAAAAATGETGAAGSNSSGAAGPNPNPNPPSVVGPTDDNTKTQANETTTKTEKAATTPVVQNDIQTESIQIDDIHMGNKTSIYGIDITSADNAPLYKAKFNINPSSDLTSYLSSIAEEYTIDALLVEVDINQLSAPKSNKSKEEETPSSPIAYIISKEASAVVINTDVVTVKGGSEISKDTIVSAVDVPIKKDQHYAVLVRAKTTGKAASKENKQIVILATNFIYMGKQAKNADIITKLIQATNLSSMKLKVMSKKNYEVLLTGYDPDAAFYTRWYHCTYKFVTEHWKVCLAFGLILVVLLGYIIVSFNN